MVAGVVEGRKVLMRELVESAEESSDEGGGALIPFSGIFPAAKVPFDKPKPLVNRFRMVEFLQQMGFTEKQAKTALSEQSYNLDNAFNYLASQTNPQRVVVPCISNDNCFHNGMTVDQVNKQAAQMYSEESSSEQSSASGSGGKAAVFLELIEQVRAARRHRRRHARSKPGAKGGAGKAKGGAAKQGAAKQGVGKQGAAEQSASSGGAEEAEEESRPNLNDLQLTPVEYPPIAQPSEESSGTEGDVSSSDDGTEEPSGGGAGNVVDSREQVPEGVSGYQEPIEESNGAPYGKLPGKPPARREVPLKEPPDEFTDEMLRRQAIQMRDWRMGPPGWYKSKLLETQKAEEAAEAPVPSNVPSEVWPAIVPVKHKKMDGIWEAQWVHPMPYRGTRLQDMGHAPPAKPEGSGGFLHPEAVDIPGRPQTESPSPNPLQLATETVEAQRMAYIPE